MNALYRFLHGVNRTHALLMLILGLLPIPISLFMYVPCVSMVLPIASPIVSLLNNRMRNSGNRPHDSLKHFHKQMFKIILCWKQPPPSGSFCTLEKIGKDYLRVFFFLWYNSERMYTYRKEAQA